LCCYYAEWRAILPEPGTNLISNNDMLALLMAPMFAAAGYSLIYLLCGGGLGGAVLIFIVAKMLGK
jgi:hypothetical protein